VAEREEQPHIADTRIDRELRQADEDAPAAQITRDVVAIERARGVIAGRAAVNPVATRAYDIVHVGSADPDLSRSMIGDDLKLPELIVIEIEGREATAAPGPVHIQSVDCVDMLAGPATMNGHTSLLIAL